MKTYQHWGVRLLAAAGLLVAAAGPATAAPADPLGTQTASSSSRYQALEPVRLADTRPDGTTVDDEGPHGAAGAGSTVVVPVAGRGGVPFTGAAAVAVNITSAGATANTFITAFPSGTTRPTISTLNPTARVTTAAMSIVKLGADGSISLFNARGATHLMVDVLGWFPVGDSYGPLDPARFADTREGQHTIDDAGPRGAVGPGQTVVVPVAGRDGVPATGAAAVAVSITATVPSANTYITAFPTGMPRPTASTLTPGPRTTTAVMSIVKLGADGSISLFNARGATHLMVDVLGWFPVGDSYGPLDPARFADTREGQHTIDDAGPRGAVGPGQTVVVPVAGRDGVPATGAAAVAVSITAVLPSANTYITAFPTGKESPTASNLNPARRQSTSNMAIVKLGDNGSISLFNASGTTHITLDVIGWFPARDAEQPPVSGKPVYWGTTLGGASASAPTNVAPAGVLEGKSVTAVSAGLMHSCAINSQAEAACWGFNYGGQLGDGTNYSQPIPVAVSTAGVLANKEIAAISAGDHHTCAATTDGIAACWGRNTFGQLGDGTNNQSNVPVAVSASGPLAGKKVASIAAGDAHTCATTTDGIAVCWGHNSRGQLGNENHTDSNVPVQVVAKNALTGAKLSGISAGKEHSCALTDAGLGTCWGINVEGQLGNGVLGGSAWFATAVSTEGVLQGRKLIDISAGDGHTCGATDDGLAVCWGSNSRGELGNGGLQQETSVPVAVDATGVLLAADVVKVATGSMHSCAITSSGVAACWGTAGTLGIGSGLGDDVPVAVATDGALAATRVVDISAHSLYTVVAAEPTG